MRKILIALAILLGVIFIFIRQAELAAILETLQRGDWRFLFLGLLIEILWMFNQSVSYSSIYRALGLKENLSTLFRLAVAANFVNIVAPTAGMGGMAVFISDGKRNGHSAARVTMAGVLFVLFEYIGVLVAVALGLIVLFRRNNLTAAELTAAGILTGLAAGLATLIYLGLHSETALGNLLAWSAAKVNRILQPFIKRDYLSQERAYSFAHEAAEGLRQVRREPRQLVWPLILAMTSKILLILIFTAMFLAFKVPFSIGTVIAGFSIGYLFTIVSPTPAGIGVVEGALTLVLRTLGVPLGAAAVVALSYRGITFWTPLLFGMLMFRWLSRGEKAKSLA